MSTQRKGSCRTQRLHYMSVTNLAARSRSPFDVAYASATSKLIADNGFAVEHGRPAKPEAAAKRPTNRRICQFRLVHFAPHEAAMSVGRCTQCFRLIGPASIKNEYIIHLYIIRSCESRMRFGSGIPLINRQTGAILFPLSSPVAGDLHLCEYLARYCDHCDITVIIRAVSRYYTAALRLVCGDPLEQSRRRG